ncbi:4212_t:CDS:2, partial [Funneliformis geosporum]
LDDYYYSQRGQSPIASSSSSDVQNSRSRTPAIRNSRSRSSVTIRNSKSRSLVTIQNSRSRTPAIEKLKSKTSSISSINPIVDPNNTNSLGGQNNYIEAINSAIITLINEIHSIKEAQQSWRISLDLDKQKLDKKRKETNFRRGDKKERKQKGIAHMLDTNNNLFDTLHLSSLNLNEFKENCELIMNKGEYHSDEVFETDEELVKKEVQVGI